MNYIALARTWSHYSTHVAYDITERGSTVNMATIKSV